jgi:hypothetical protein
MRIIIVECSTIIIVIIVMMYQVIKDAMTIHERLRERIRIAIYVEDYISEASNNCLEI